MMRLASMLPELTLLAGLLLVLLAPLCWKRSGDATACREGAMAFVLTQITLWVAILASFLSGALETPVPEVLKPYLFFSPLSRIFQPAVLLTASLTLFYARGTLEKEKLWRPETFALILCALIGAMVVTGAYHFTLIYLGVELMSLPIYAVIALRADQRGALAAEASLKYFFLGALASAMLLYGFSLMYGATGSLSLLGLGHFSGHQELLLLGFFFVVAAMAFKLSLVPFHMWAPDIYQGIPTFLSLFVSTVPKLAAVVLLLRLIGNTEPLLVYWQGTLSALAVLSMILGGVVAVAQTNLKRLLAYSTIGHMGYLLLGAMVDDSVGVSAGVFYILTYISANLVAFGVLLSVGGGERPLETLRDFRGLMYRSPLRAGLMSLAMLSLAGVPPLVGFFGKFSVIEVAWNYGFTALAVVAILTSVVAAFYYLRVIAIMAFASEESQKMLPLSAGPVSLVLLTINGLILLLLGIFPQLLLTPIAHAVNSLLQII